MVQAEYSRGINGSDMILPLKQQETAETYPARMLTANVVPGLLRCRLQSLDGHTRAYYDITSRISLAELYEEEKVRGADLFMLLDSFARVMDSLSEYLLAPEMLLLSPETIFTDAARSKADFCFLPGASGEISQQLRELMEYLLPKLDHGDAQAVSMGYGVYRRCMEAQLNLAEIKEEIYRKGSQGNGILKQPKTEKEPENILQAAKPDLVPRQMMPDPDDGEPEEEWILEEEKEPLPLWPRVCFVLASAATCTGLVTAKQFGYLPDVSVETILGGSIICLAVGMLLFQLGKRQKEKREERIPARSLMRDQGGQPPRKITVEGYRNQERSLQRIKESRSGEQAMRDGSDSAGSFTEEGKNAFGYKEPDCSQSVWNTAEPLSGCGETQILTAAGRKGPASLVSREPGELVTIFLEKDLTVIGKMENAADAIIPLPTISRVHAKVRKKGEEYYLTDLNSKNGTAVNGRMLHPEEEYLLADQDEVDFAQARYIFLA
ncbi:MAG: FHA domain-containing protein [Blautia sp.]|nr:FHA domain-containing protein [Blautia sp.]